MEEHYIKDVGKITYVYGVNLEEHKTVIEKQQKRIAELEQELAKYKDLQDRLGLENVDEFEWFVMLDLLTDNEKNMHILDLHRELAELKEKDNYHLRYELAGADETIANLKQQLVEKEKELAYMTKQAKKFNNEAQKYYEDAYCNSFQNQKAIAELERLKEEFNGAFSFSTQQEMFDKYIDQQIAELKGETNE